MTNATKPSARAPYAGPARPPVILVSFIALTIISILTARLLMPEPRSPISSRPPAHTTQMADVRSVEAILEAVQQAVRNNELAKAKTILESAVEQYPRDQTLRLTLADLFVRMTAKTESDEQKPTPEQIRDLQQQAYEQFSQALQIGPRKPEIEFAAGSLARALGKLDSALAHFQSACTLDKTNASYPLHLAQVYFSRNQLDQARARLAVAVSLDPSLATARGMLAEIALRQGAPRVALEQLAKAVELEPETPAWRLMQARAFNRVSQPEQALNAIDQLPPDARFTRTALQLAGQACGLAQTPEKALERYEQAIKRGPVEPLVYLDAAVWAKRLNQTERAQELAKLAAMADVPGAKRMLDQLETGP